MVVAWITLFISFGDWAIDRWVVPMDEGFARLCKTAIILMGSTVATVYNNRAGLKIEAVEELDAPGERQPAG